MRKLVFASLIAAIALSAGEPAHPHGGGVDSSGRHTDFKTDHWGSHGMVVHPNGCKCSHQDAKPEPPHRQPSVELISQGPVSAFPAG